MPDGLPSLCVEQQHDGSTNPTPGTLPKWVAVVADTLIPLPRRKLKVRVILAQAGKENGVLVRDYDQPHDVPLDPNAEIDMGDGNVFRIVPSCEAPGPVVPSAPAKLAFVVDDAWEVTIIPRQTHGSLLDLFGLPDDTRLFRDYESPNDQLIHPKEQLLFADGPVFRVEIKQITVKVNGQDVHFHRRRETGLEIKKAAIAQGVSIEVGFVLYRAKPDGRLGPVVNDDEQIVLQCGDEFVCVAPDDNS